MNSVDIKEHGLVLNLASQLISSSNFINHNGISRHQKQVSDGIDGVNLGIEQVIDFVEGFEQDAVFLVASAKRSAVWCDDESALLEIADYDVEKLVGWVNSWVLEAGAKSSWVSTGSSSPLVDRKKPLPSVVTIKV
jgi:hypothetical protein